MMHDLASAYTIIRGRSQWWCKAHLLTELCTQNCSCSARCNAGATAACESVTGAVLLGVGLCGLCCALQLYAGMAVFIPCAFSLFFSLKKCNECASQLQSQGASRACTITTRCIRR